MRLLYYQPWTLVADIPEAVGVNVEDAITLVGDAEWFACGYTQESCSLNIVKVRDRSGKRYDVKLSCVVSFQNAVNEATFEEMDDFRYILLARDMNNKVRILGDVAQKAPCEFSWEAVVDEKHAGGNKYLLTWTVSMRHTAYFYQATLENPADPSVQTSPFVTTTFQIVDFTGDIDDVNTDFVLANEVENELVTVNGMVYKAGEDYTLTGVNLVFTNPPPTGSIITVRGYY